MTVATAVGRIPPLPCSRGFDGVTLIAKSHGAALSVMDGGEHWFHTDAQMIFLDNWIKNG